MIFIIPIILGAVALATGALGVAKGVEGFSHMQEAEELGKKAQKRYESAVNSMKADWEDTQKLAEEYGQIQIDVRVRTVGRFVDFIKGIGLRSSTSDMDFLAGLEGISVQQIKEYEAAAIEAERFAKGGIGALGAAAAAGQGTIGLIGLFGTASTGTAIAGLSGAAAWNATLAWLGGGSLAVGGGGMALGTVVLGGITIGPALAIGGFVLASEGEKALTKAREYEAQANIEIAKIHTAKDFLGQIRRRISDLKSLVIELEIRANAQLDFLESALEFRQFDRQQDAGKFQQVGLLMKALVEIMKTPVLDSEGNLNSATTNITAKYLPLKDN